MNDSISSKELVATWLAAGPSSTEGQAMVADDFVWQSPRSMAGLFGSDDGVLRSEQLADLGLVSRALYADDPSNSGTNVHFMIAEGDIVVMELDVARTTHDGDSYRNAYCITVQVRDGKIVKVREHADTLYNEQVCMGTPGKRTAVLDRLARLRAEAEH